MASGLPAIAHRRIGAAYDLVKESQNGYLIENNNAIQYAEAISSACTSREHLKALGENAKSTMDDWGVRQYVNGFYDALKYILNN